MTKKKALVLLVFTMTFTLINADTKKVGTTTSDFDLNSIVDLSKYKKTEENESIYTTRSNEKDLINNIKKYSDTTYIGALEKIKNSYIFEEANNAIKDDYTFVDTSYHHDQNAINKKLDELKQEQSLAILLGTVEEIDNIIVQNYLMDAFHNWEGVKYKWGGDSKSGIDCSALTRRIYRQVFSFELPRVSTSQITRGRKVERKDLKPGDILYFRPENRTNHTAVYVGNSLFINASTSKGVVLSSLDNSYWNKYFKFGVRVDSARTQE